MPHLTQLDLDDLRCADPKCTHDACVIELRSRCHPRTPLFAHYDKTTGDMTMTCSLCRRQVESFRLAP